MEHNKSVKKVFFRIIIPNYNNYIYLKKCLDSVLEQTFQDYFCVVVDDVSTDKSPKIAQIYSKRYPDKFAFVQLDKKRYAGGARNMGLLYPIISEYTQFIDGDDFLYNENSLKNLYQNLVDLKTDILVFDWVRTKAGSSEFINSEAHGRKLEDFIYRLGNCPWNGAPLHTIRSSMVENFIENCGYGEDTMSWMKSWNKWLIPKYKQIDDTIYVYRTNPNSVVQTYNRNGTGIRKTSQGIFYRELELFSKTCLNEYVMNSIKMRILSNCDSNVKERILNNLKTCPYSVFNSLSPNYNIQNSLQSDTILQYLMGRNTRTSRNKPGIQKYNGKRILNLQNHKFLNKIFSKSSVCNKINNNTFYDFAFLWGNGLSRGNVETLRYAIHSKNTQILLCEDGFIRSYDTWVNNKTDPKLIQSCSLIIDSLGYYFDATKPTDIENMLNDRSLVLSDEQILFARKMIDKIVSNKISKYNHQPMDVTLKNIGNRPRKILVVDQSYGDFSIKKGLANDNTFTRMLKDAISENPDSDVVVKTHPDAMVGNGIRKGYYQGLRPSRNVYPLTQPINPYTLFRYVDDVYVCSSQLGFEALMSGKKVHVYGAPFYSNWGITIDKQIVNRRRNRRTLEEIFYIFYILYTTWFNPENNNICDIETVIDYMIKLRAKYGGKNG